MPSPRGGEDALGPSGDVCDLQSTLGPQACGSACQRQQGVSCPGPHGRGVQRLICAAGGVDGQAPAPKNALASVMVNRLLLASSWILVPAAPPAKESQSPVADTLFTEMWPAADALQGRNPRAHSRDCGCGG